MRDLFSGFGAGVVVPRGGDVLDTMRSSIRTASNELRSSSAWARRERSVCRVRSSCASGTVWWRCEIPRPLAEASALRSPVDERPGVGETSRFDVARTACWTDGRKTKGSSGWSVRPWPRTASASWRMSHSATACISET